ERRLNLAVTVERAAERTAFAGDAGGQRIAADLAPADFDVYRYLVGKRLFEKLNRGIKSRQETSRRKGDAGVLGDVNLHESWRYFTGTGDVPGKVSFTCLRLKISLINRQQDRPNRLPARCAAR